MMRRMGMLAVVGLGFVLAAHPVMANEPVVENPEAQRILSFVWTPLRLLAQILPEHKQGIVVPVTDRDPLVFAGD